MKIMNYLLLHNYGMYFVKIVLFDDFSLASSYFVANA